MSIGKNQANNLFCPLNEADVREAVAGKSPNDYIINRADTGGKENIHAFRRGVARRAYDYYSGRIDREGETYRKELKDMCISRMSEYHINPNTNRDWKLIDNPYVTRPNDGSSPQAFDRLALMVASIFYLSHWRAAVTVQNYLIK